MIDSVGAEPVTLDSDEWYGSMVTLRLPHVPPAESWPGRPHPLQSALWEQHRIEVPVFQRGETVHLRVSCHLYNIPDDSQRLVEALEQQA